MRRALVVLSLSLFILLLVAPVQGDTIYLKNGGKFEGKLLKETATGYVFKIKGMGQQTFKKSDVLKIEKGESTYDVYEKRRKDLKADDAEGLYQLGLWCEENGLRKESRLCYKAAVKVDEDHAGARDKLGYVKYEGSWITKKKYDEILKEIQAKEKTLLDSMKLTKMYKDTDARFKIGIPEGWEQDKIDGGSITFNGPTLGKVPVVVKLEAESAGDTLDVFAETIEKSLKREHEDIVRLAEPAAAELNGRQAKVLVMGYSRDDLAVDAVPVEHRCVVAVDPAGDFVLTFVYRRGYYDILKPFFDQVEKSVRIMSKPLDLEKPDYGYGVTFPDDTYSTTDAFPLTVGETPVKPTPGTGIVRGAARGGIPIPVFFLVIPGKKGDGKADTTSLQTLRDSMLKMLPIQGGMVQLSGEQKERKVAGVDALSGELTIAGGTFGRSYWAVFSKGDRYYACAFVNTFGQLGPQYAKEDFEKFLNGFQFVDKE